MTTYVDQHIQVLRDFLRADVQRSIEDSQRWADEAAAAGDESWRKMHQDDVDRLKAIRFYWETDLPE